MSQTAISDSYRQKQARLNRQAADRLARVFPSLNFRNIDASAAGWILAVERIGSDLHAASETLARETYLAYRRDAGVTGRPRFINPTSDREALRTSLLIEGPYAAKHQLSGGARIPDVARIVFGNSSGTILNFGQQGGRDLFTDTVTEDRDAVGYKRIARATACRFCRMLADRGAVYRDATVFASHRHCQCTAVPVFRGGETGPEASAMQYTASSKTRSSEDRDNLRAYLDAFYPAQ